MRPIWTGALSFGLVTLPVQLYSATAGTAIDFDYLHKKDLSPIRYAKVCRKDGHEIPYEDIVKGYEYSDGDYVVLTEEDFKKANVRKTQLIDVVSFTTESEVDPIYSEKPYYLEPIEGSDKAYVILRDALKKSKKVGVAKFVLRNREHLGIVKPMGNILVLDQLRFSDEMKQPKSLEIQEREPSGKEINMALQLINQLTEHFKPEKFHDTYQQELQDLIDKKTKGKKIEPKGEPPEITKGHDLMETLKKSLLEAKKHRPQYHET
jgi:DNA end-binding protein Ku